MRNTISLVLLISSFFSFSQRISFEDPDLTFSFKKPKNWEVFDDGYVVKVSPSARDTANIYFAITYFENAQPFGIFSNVTPAGDEDGIIFNALKIAGSDAKNRQEIEDKTFLNSYTFRKYNQRFELKTSTTNPKDQRIFRRIIKSIKVEK